MPPRHQMPHGEQPPNPQELPRPLPQCREIEQAYERLERVLEETTPLLTEMRKIKNRIAITPPPCLTEANLSSWQAIKEFGKKIEGEAKCLEEVSPEILIAALIRRMSLLAFEKTTLVCCYEKYLEWRQHIYGSYFKKLVRESFELRMKALDAKRDLITYFDHTYVERRQSNSQDIDGHEKKVNGTS